jgi:sulfatase maturation enzyme AslB (radical SAM superfamily)
MFLFNENEQVIIVVSEENEKKVKELLEPFTRLFQNKIESGKIAFRRNKPRNLIGDYRIFKYSFNQKIERLYEIPTKRKHIIHDILR